MARVYPVICDRCGFRYPSNKTKMEWTGWRVCDECWEPKHPQLSIKAKADKQSVPKPRPRQPMRFRRLDDDRIVGPNTESPKPVKQYDPGGQYD